MKTNDTPTNHRLFVSNFEESTTIQELADRFSPFGKINSLEIIKSKNIAFLSIETTLENISKCIGIYKSRKYKNSFLRIEHASLFYRQRLNIEKQAMETSRKNIENQVMLKLKSQAEKMKLINDDNCDDRKGWKRSRYGRAVCVMKMKRQGERRIRNFDPSRYKNGLIKFKFSDLDVDSSVCDLTWKIEGYDDDVSIDEDDDEQDVQDVIMDCADRKHVLEDQVATYEYLIEEQAKDREQVQQDQVATDKHLIGEQAKDQEQVQQDQVTNDEPLIEEQVTKQELQIEEPIEDANQDIIMDDSNQIQKESDKIQPIEIKTNYELKNLEKTVSKTNTVINVNLRSLVLGFDSTESFSLFTENLPVLEKQEIPLQKPNTEKEEIKDNNHEEPIIASSSLFFLSIPSENPRSIYNVVDQVFQRTESLEEINRLWIEKRRDLTWDYKSKYRSGVKSFKRSFGRNK